MTEHRRRDRRLPIDRRAPHPESSRPIAPVDRLDLAIAIVVYVAITIAGWIVAGQP